MVNYNVRPLIDYVPSVLKDAKEFQVLANSEQEEVINLYAAIQNIMDNQYIETSTEIGIRRWEKILDIIPNTATETLQFRRNRILLRLQLVLPFTERWLQQKVNELFSAGNVTFKVDYNNYKINVTISQGDMNLLNEVKLLMRKMVPANMVWMFEIVAVALENTVFTGLNVNARAVTQTTFGLVPESYPLRATANVGIIGAFTRQIKFEME